MSLVGHVLGPDMGFWTLGWILREKDPRNAFVVQAGHVLDNEMFLRILLANRKYIVCHRIRRTAVAASS